MIFSNLNDFYSGDHLMDNRNRFSILQKEFKKLFQVNNPVWFSASGRTEICGNHTDHNQGKVLAAAIQLDTIAIASPNDNMMVEISSYGFDRIEIDLNQLSVQESEIESSAALVRGIAAFFKKNNLAYGGFKACISSRVFSGSGLSSSASFESLIGSILNFFYNSEKINLITLAKAGQFAENVYFGKPSGLMDQLACIYGGILEIDFKDPPRPLIKRIDYSFENNSYDLLIVNTGQGHENLNSEYAAIPTEMKRIAQIFNKKVLREVDEKLFFSKLSKLMKIGQDRSILRAIHFFAENNRVDRLSESLRNNNLTKSLNIIRESGNSSFKFLQNIYPENSTHSQPLSLALSLCEQFLNLKKRGVCRVHGGGFAGTIQVFIHQNDREQLTIILEEVFGKGCCTKIKIRQHGLLIFPDEQA
jgi:galactokinase